MIYILCQCHTHDIAVVCFRFIDICLTMIVLWSQREERPLILAKKMKTKQKQHRNQTQIHKNKLTGIITKKKNEQSNKNKVFCLFFFPPVFWFVFSVCSGFIFSLSLKNMCKTIHSLRSWTRNDSSLTFSLYIIYTGIPWFISYVIPMIYPVYIFI